MLLELRFETLWDYVDYFVISEATYTHTGLPREPHFNLNNFAKYESKIRYLRLDEKPEGDNDFWKNENFIRNNISKGLYDAKSDDLILISDLDEIPRPEKISVYCSRYLRGDFEQSYYSYFLNNYWIGDVNKKGFIRPKSNHWYGSKITTFKYFVEFFNSNATSVRSFKSSGLLRSIKRYFFRKFKTQLISNGGWHFTWVLDIPDLIKKIESTAHQEFNTKDKKTPEHIRKIISSGHDLNKPNARYQKKELDSSFPSFLIKNENKFKDYLL